MLKVRDYFSMVAGGQDSVPVDELVEMVKSGKLRLSGDDDILYSYQEVADMFGRDVRSVIRWGAEGKLKVLDTIWGKAIPQSEVDNLYASVPLTKKNTVVYFRGTDVEELNKDIYELFTKQGLDKHRCKVFVDTSGDDGLKALMAHLIRNRCTLYTNCNLTDGNDIYSVILSSTGTVVTVVE